MSDGTSNKDGHIVFIQLVASTFPYKETNRTIMLDYSMELKLTPNNYMESYQQDLLCHFTQYNSIKGTEWKKITNDVIKIYRKIDEPAFQTRLNTIIITAPMTQTQHTWLSIFVK
jgi:hypothetical protein